MFALKFVAVFAVVALAYGKDYDSAIWMLRCAQYAITHGVAEAKIPMHTPLRVNKTFEQSGNYGLIGYNAKIENITWAGIPEWKLLDGEQLSADTDDVARLKFHLWWKAFEIHADYSVVTKEAGLEQQIGGTATLIMDEVNWTGILSVKKGKNGERESFPGLELSWKVNEVKTDIPGAGIPGNGLATAIRLYLTHFFAQPQQPGVASFITNILETRWAQDGARVQRIIDFCKKNGI